MSPDFINRFNVIVLEDQLENLDDDSKKSLVKFLLVNSYNENRIHQTIKEQEQKEKNNGTDEKLDKELENINFENIGNQEDNFQEDKNQNDQDLDEDRKSVV